MSIDISHDASSNTIVVTGRIDTLTSNQLEVQLLPAITQDSPSITIDCSAVDYISSTGLRVFILADKKATQMNGSVTIKGLDEFLKDIFDVSGLTDFFNLFKFITLVVCIIGVLQCHNSQPHS